MEELYRGVVSVEVVTELDNRVLQHISDLCGNWNHDLSVELSDRFHHFRFEGPKTDVRIALATIYHFSSRYYRGNVPETFKVELGKADF